MKKSIRSLSICVLASFILVACQNQGATDEAPVDPAEEPALAISPTMEADVAVVQRYFDALLVADSLTMREVTTDGFITYLAKNPMDSSDIDAVVANWKAIAELRSNQKVERVAVSALKVREGERYAGTWVQYWGNYSATMNDSGVEIVVPFFINNLLVNGKIHRAYSYYDRLAIMQAQGYELTKKEE